jgi:hypothetical protein
MTVAEFITFERAAELLDELRKMPTGSFRCHEVVLASPDASFCFQPPLSIPRSGSDGEPLPRYGRRPGFARIARWRYGPIS